MEKHIYFLTVVLVILVCFFIFRYLSKDYLEYRKLNPYLIEHTRQINNNIQAISDHKIRKSIDQHHGMEFTYAFWFKIDTINDTDRHNILLKGNSETEQCPGIYVFKDTDNTMGLQVDISVFNNKNDCDKYTEEYNCNKNLCHWMTDDQGSKCVPWKCDEIKNPNIIDCNTPVNNIPCCSQLSNYCDINTTDPNNAVCQPKVKETCIVNNLPIQKWTHLIVMLVGNYLDIYINGNLYERFEIKGVPKQNNIDLQIGANPSANGSIMRLQYFNYAIPASKINKIVSKNEITKDIQKEYEDESTTDYLDKNYWIGENVDPNKKMF
tara:strand:- start:1713 stop:2681 length:969 start_codon:yes stop_codon:yes gene_type:complete